MLDSFISEIRRLQTIEKEWIKIIDNLNEVFRGQIGGPKAILQGFLQSEDDIFEGTVKLAREYNKLLEAIRNHRDQRGDDRCWMDDEELYKVLPEGYNPPKRDTTVELKLCEKYINCRRNPNTEYISPQRRIEELEKENQQLKDTIHMMSTTNNWRF